MKYREEYLKYRSFLVSVIMIFTLTGLAQPSASLTAADRFLRSQRLAQHLSPVQEQHDQLDQTHVRYGQAYQGVPVFGAQLIVHLDADTTVSSSSGRILSAPQVDTRPDITAEEATHLAQQYWQQSYHTSMATVQSSTLYIFDKGFILHQPTSDPHLVWEIILNQTSPRARERFYIDAHTGQLVYTMNDIRHAINRRVYDCSRGVCLLDFSFLGYIYGRSEGKPVRGTNPIYGGTDVDDVYSIVNTTHNYYSVSFGRDGANNQGGLGDGVYSAATNTDVYTYIDGVTPDDCPNAYFDGYSINFCYALVTTDVTAHEYTHGVSAFSIAGGGFVYSGESGAIDEAYSDIFGEAVEYYSQGSNDWKMGTTLNAPGLSGPLRDLATPANLTDDVLGTPYPDKFSSSNYYCGTYDGGGVHHNSTAFSHAAYLVAMGGTFNNCTITGLGRTKQEQIFYRALTTYLTSATTFNQAYTALLDSCDDLYSTTDCKEVKKALKAVTMDQPGYCSGQTAVDPGCTSLDNAAYVSSITSNHASGNFKAGEIIDLTVTFSKAVTSTGAVTVTVETGDSDRTCSFTINNTTSATCSYTVEAGDITSALTVSGINGTVVDQDGYTITNFTPVSNLETTKTIIIDTVTPQLTDLSLLTAKAVVGKHQIVSMVLTFSEAVSSIGDIVLALDTGKTDHSCSFSVSTSETGSCNYTVMKGDLANPFSITSITGTITDLAGNNATDVVVPTSLTTDVSVTVDGVSPRGAVKINYDNTTTTSIQVVLQLNATDKGTRVKKMRFSNDGKHWSIWQKYRKKYQPWDVTNSKYGGSNQRGKKKVFVQFKDKANNRSKKFSDAIILQ